MRSTALRRRESAPHRSERTMSGGELLAYILSRADVLDAVTKGRSDHDDPVRTRWLLIPVAGSVLAQLEAFQAEADDLEDGADAEPDVDDENTRADNVDQLLLYTADDDAEDDGIDEPNVVAPEQMRVLGSGGGDDRTTLRQWRAGVTAPEPSIAELLQAKRLLRVTMAAAD